MDGGRDGQLLVDVDTLIDRDQYLVLDPLDSDEMSVAIGQLSCVQLQGIIEIEVILGDVHMQSSVDQSSNDVVLHWGLELSLAKVKHKAGGFAGPDEHGQVNVVLVVVGVGDGDHGLAVGLVLVAKGCSGVVVLTVGSQVWPVTLALVGPPEVETSALVHARVGGTLVSPGAALLRVVLGDPLLLQHRGLGHLDPIDQNVLDTANEGLVGSDQDSGLGVEWSATKVGHVEGRLAGIVRVDGVGGGVAIVEPHDQDGAVEGEVDLLPHGVVQIVPDGHPLQLPEHAGVHLELAVLQLESEEG